MDTTELAHQKQLHLLDLEHLKLLRYMDDDFMSVCLEDNFEGVIQRILALIDESGLSDKQIIKKLNVSSSSSLITDWRKGRSKSPQLRYIIELAKFFNVTTDYLLTGVIQSSDLSNDEIELLQHFRTLPDIGKEGVRGYIKGYTSAINDSK